MQESTMAKDPVCGMDVDPSQAAGQSEYNGQTYYFCSKGCKVAFDKDPQSYLNASGSDRGHGGHGGTTSH
jgi:YHS domain-containing protein